MANVQENAVHIPRGTTAQGVLHSHSVPSTALNGSQFISGPSSSSSSHSLAPHSLQASFGPTIAQLVHQYNTAPPSDELSRAQAELAQVKDIMVQNVEQILSRGERIELLVDKTDNMASQATAFRRGARTVRRGMWWKNVKVVALGGVVGMVSRDSSFSQSCSASQSGF